MSVAKICGILGGGVYLIAGLVINFVVLIFGIPSLENFDVLGFGSGILATFLVALSVGVISFIISAIFAWLYNLAANIVGGISWEEAEVAKNYHPKNKKKDKEKEKVLETVKPQDEVNDILDRPKKESEDTFSSTDNPNFLSS